MFLPGLSDIFQNSDYLNKNEKKVSSLFLTKFQNLILLKKVFLEYQSLYKKNIMKNVEKKYLSK